MWGRPLSERGLSLFCTFRFRLFHRWVTCGSCGYKQFTDSLCQSSYNKPCENAFWMKRNVKKNHFPTVCAFVELWYPFQKPFLWSDTFICIILQYWLSYHIQELEISLGNHLFYPTPVLPLPPSLWRKTPNLYTHDVWLNLKDLQGRRSYHFS